VIKANILEISDQNRKIACSELYNFGRLNYKASEFFFANILNQEAGKYKKQTTSEATGFERRKEYPVKAREKQKKKDIDNNSYSAHSTNNLQYADTVAAGNSGINFNKYDDIDKGMKKRNDSIYTIDEVKQKLAEILSIQSINDINSEAAVEELKNILDFLMEQENVLTKIESIESINIEDIKLLLEEMSWKFDNRNGATENIVNDSLSQFAMLGIPSESDNTTSLEEVQIGQMDKFLAGENVKIAEDTKEAQGIYVTVENIESEKPDEFAQSNMGDKLAVKLADTSDIDEIKQGEENINLQTGESDSDMTLDNEGDLKFDMHAQENQGFLYQQDSAYGGFEKVYNRYGNFYSTLHENSVSFESQGIEVKTDIFSGNVTKENIISQVAEKVKTLISEEKSEMLIEMKPELLGKVTLKVLTENDVVRAEFYTENIHVKEILESNFQALRDALEESGFSAQEFSVSVQDQKYGNEFSFNGNRRNNLSSKTGGRAIKNISSVKISSDYGLDRDDVNLDNWGWTGINLNLMA
jgi:hypothetical protein